MTRTYRFAMTVCAPIVRWWGRLEVSGLEHLPAEGPVLLAGNHDSYWDPVAVGVAALPRRQIQALAKSSLWKPGLGPVLDGMGQIPIVRGQGDAHAMDRAIATVRFFSPAEGGLREGEELAALGARLLAEIRAEAPIVAAGRRRRESVT